VLFAVYDLPRGPTSAFSNIALLGAVAGLVVAAGLTVTLARAALGTWHASLAAMVAAAGAALVTALTTAADLALGRFGLLALLAVCVAVLVLAYRLHYSRAGTAP